MTCKDCIHYVVCAEEGIYFTDKYIKGATISNDVRTLCHWFKNKTDIVEVVRCKDCAYFKQSVSALFPEASCFICDHPYGMKKNITENYFCSCGERGVGV